MTELATAMRVSAMTVHRLIRSGDLPAVRFGKSYRIPEVALREYLWGSAAEPLRRAGPGGRCCDRCGEALEGER
ncbi:helix-turn-helix domain-containing protein [Phytohabitans maris]|uniref:helix-turn-helix domain-containing protein n=1 Tax=Phytohabitans maris TaxID=3071409 RepID=UPI003D1843C0